MAEYVERLWQLDDAGGLSRKDRMPGRYLAYVPDELGDRLPVWRRRPPRRTLWRCSLVLTSGSALGAGT